MIEGHLRRIKNSPVYGGCQKYVFIERNYGGDFTVDMIRKICEQKEFDPLVVVSYDETPKERFGIWMTDDVKKNMMFDLQRSISEGMLCFAKDFIHTGDTVKSKAAIKDKFKAQLQNFRQEVVNPKDVAIGITKTYMTGKSSGR
jgi:hypoxanthine-guanine phosphoribosyltransferase